MREEGNNQANPHYLIWGADDLIDHSAHTDKNYHLSCATYYCMSNYFKIGVLHFIIIFHNKQYMY